jgi:magnesium chelatase family protein
MLARVQSFVLTGIEALPCEVEIDILLRDMPATQIVGLPAGAVKESLDRVQAACTNSGYAWPHGRVLINLAPAEMRKEGPVYDLPIAIGVLLAAGTIPAQRSQTNPAGLDHRACLFAGEVALDGRVRPVKGMISMALLARRRGARHVIVPAENAVEAAVVEGIEVYGVRTLAEVVGLLTGAIERDPHPAVDVASLIQDAQAETDFAEVRGQEGVKRAITVAAAGGHNLLMIGPAGTGKSMMAKALPGVLPPLSPGEALEVTRIYSAAGLLCGNGNGDGDGGGLVTVRPVRTPHHTASTPALIGGGQVPRPGEVTLAHRGVLFLDELPEFSRDVLETLRQPLEDDTVTIARAHSSVRFPASFMLVAAMNPTPRGDREPGEIGRREMERYLSRISGPLIDRVDIHVEAPAVPWKELTKKDHRGTSSAAMRDAVLKARERQRARQGDAPNARLRGKRLDEVAAIEEDAQSLLGRAVSELGLSARAYDKIRRVARTIGDLEDSDTVTTAHVAEAVQYRLLDRPAWGLA